MGEKRGKDAPPPVSGEIVLYLLDDCRGLHTHLWASARNLVQLPLTNSVTETWNNVVSSFVIVSGRWKFYAEPDFQDLLGPEDGLGPGRYPRLPYLGVENDTISSIRKVV